MVLLPFVLESGVVFEGTTKVLTHLQLQFQMNKNEIEIGEFEMHLKNFSVCALI